jgi:hypothetical protein
MTPFVEPARIVVGFMGHPPMAWSWVIGFAFVALLALGFAAGVVGSAVVDANGPLVTLALIMH